MSSRGRRLPWLLLLAALVGAAVTPAAAGPREDVDEPANHRIVTPRFVLWVTVPRKVGERYAELCSKAYRKFCRIFHVPPHESVWRGKCKVYLFANRGQFIRFATVAHKTDLGRTAGGYTRIRGRNPEIALFLHDGNHVRLQQTLVHEMTHVFVALLHKPAAVPTWMHEGCAQFFEFQHHPERSRLARWKKLVKHLVRTGKYRPLATLWEQDFGADDHVAYAQSWSVLDFLIHAGESGSRRTSRFLLLLKEGRSQEDALGAAFGCDLARLEAAWKHYVLKAY